MEFTVTAAHPTLYKRGSKGEVRVWFMELGHTEAFIDGPGAHRVVSGILDGAMTTSGWTVCEPKNVGRSNATTSAYQAEAEIFNMYAIKESRDYFRTVTDIDKVQFTKPMLALDYDKRVGKFDVTKGVYAQPKFDGIRCIARADGLWTRTGKPIMGVPHVWGAVAHLFDSNPDLILDGELYNHKLRDDFNTITSIVRKASPTEEELEKSCELIQYHIYDMPSEGGGFETRHEALQGIFDLIGEGGIVQRVETIYVTTQAELDALNTRWLKEGYEGEMVRLLWEEYAFGRRSGALLKRKQWITEEFPIKSILAGTGNWAGVAKTAVVSLPDGGESEATFTGSQEEMQALLENPSCPDWGTVKYFGYTPAGKLRFPNVIDYGWGQRVD
ncbi:DNA ligase [Ruegeria phage vB_RpoS-V10]|nr:DNA ligase [Roseobacter phage DSS3P8]AWY09236.1 DNA ligase [Ruegeria phage vB_RpoS-V10]